MEGSVGEGMEGGGDNGSWGKGKSILRFFSLTKANEAMFFLLTNK